MMISLIGGRRKRGDAASVCGIDVSRGGGGGGGGGRGGGGKEERTINN